MGLSTHEIRQHALEHFDKVGIADAAPLPHADSLLRWLERGFHGEMEYMARNADKRMDIRLLCPGAKRVVVVADNHYLPGRRSGDPRMGKIARYALGRDYHDVMRQKARRLIEGLRGVEPSLEARFFVDTAPVLERLWAQQAGIGWQGKHSNIVTEFGSWVFLGVLAVNLPLECDTPAVDRCGTCRACIDACPTGAIVAPRTVDATRCLAYLTIEKRGDSVPEFFRGRMDRWIFGCDACQDACPWNRKFARPAREIEYSSHVGDFEVDLREIEGLDEAAFRLRFAKTPVMRAPWRDFLRNARACREG